MAVRAKFMCNMWRIVPSERRGGARRRGGEGKKKEEVAGEVTEHTAHNVDDKKHSEKSD